jgi:phosphoribosylformylglycinamidine cyclo-ligase
MPAVLPPGVAARFQAGSWPVPPIFSIIQREGEVSLEEMYRVFNMGLGMVAVCEEASIPRLQAAAPDALVVGRIVARQGDEQVVFE